MLEFTLPRLPWPNYGFELLQHPAYAPDLAPSDFYLFPKLKSHLLGHQFRNNDEVIHAIKYLADQDSNFFLEGIAMLEDHFTKCIDVKGDYIEKY